jgi:hypothetical protein
MGAGKCTLARVLSEYGNEILTGTGWRIYYQAEDKIHLVSLHIGEIKHIILFGDIVLIYGKQFNLKDPHFLENFKSTLKEIIADYEQFKSV